MHFIDLNIKYIYVSKHINLTVLNYDLFTAWLIDVIYLLFYLFDMHKINRYIVLLQINKI